LRLRLLPESKLVILLARQRLKHAHDWACRKRSCKAYQCLIQDVSNHALCVEEVGVDAAKYKMKLFSRFILAAALGFFPHLVQAQTALRSSINNDLAPVRPDSIVQVAAESQGLQLVLPEQVPASGTFWWVMPGGMALPTPCPPQDLSGAIYQIADGQFLVDKTGGQVEVNSRRLGLQAQVTSSIVASEVVSQADALVNLITQVQTTTENQEVESVLLASSLDVSGPPIPGDGGSGDGSSGNTNSYPICTFDHTQLWLEITNVSNGWTYLNLHNATNQVYAIRSTTNLLTPLTNWPVETEVWPTDTNCMPFTIQNLNRQDVFLRAEDWTEVTENGNATPDWWLWKYFGTTAWSDTNLDSQGNTFLSDYQQTNDPNIIRFTIETTHDYVNTGLVPMQLNLTAGNPNYYAVLVNGQPTNWLPFVSTNLTVDLGSTDGVYDVCVGLRGLPADATQTWNDYRYTLDTVPPLVVITNLAALSGSRPFIDPAGYTTKALSYLTFEVTGADGTITHDEGSVTDQDCNPADMCHTTNHFVCLDVALTLGTNQIAVNAVDWAGNVTVTNFNYIFDTNGDTTPPAIALVWPQDGMEVSGSSFTLRGTLDDDTAKVFGQWTDTNGVTQMVGGLVERGGQFWLDNLPLNSGTNIITVMATDAAGNVMTTNLSLLKSDVMLAMNAVGASQLNQVWVDVTGAISDPTYAVWVNGVQGTNNGDGTWSAANVPVTSGGTASFDLTGYPPDYVPSGASWTNFAVVQTAYPNPMPADSTQAHVDWDKPDVVYVKENKFKVISYEDTLYYDGSGTDDQSWAQGSGGHWNINDTGADTTAYLNDWPGDAGDMPVVSGLGSYQFDDVNEYTNQNIGVPNVEWIDSAVASGVDRAESRDNDIIPITWAATGGKVVELFTGGKAQRQSKSLFILSQTLMQLKYSVWAERGLYAGDIAPQQITLGAYGNLDSDGTLTVTAGNGQHVVITPHAPGNWYGGNLPSQTKYSPSSWTWYPALTNTNRDRTTVGVGEQVDLFGMPVDTAWTTSAGSLSATNGNVTTFTAPSNAPSGGVIATVIGTCKTASMAVLFNVVPPSGIDHAKIIATNHYSIGVAGAGMGNAIWIAPTSVSFYRVEIVEVGEPATNVTGYFTNFPPSDLDHRTHGADHWFYLTADNKWSDTAAIGPLLPPWLSGEFSWTIPANWKVGESGSTNFMNGWTQVFEIDWNGTVSINKFENTIVRDTNDVINPK
jgi:hypothetical protein